MVSLMVRMADEGFPGGRGGYDQLMLAMDGSDKWTPAIHKETPVGE